MQLNSAATSAVAVNNMVSRNITSLTEILEVTKSFTGYTIFKTVGFRKQAVVDVQATTAANTVNRI